MKNKLIISHITGGFGNQLFQFGTGLALAMKLNTEFKVDVSVFEQEKFKNWYRLDKINVNIEQATKEEIERLKNKPNAPLFFKVLKKTGLHNKYKKKTDITDIFGFKPDPRILNLKDSAYISGWCPKEIYVREIRQTLIEQFKPKLPMSPIAEKYLQKIQTTNSVSVHIRRGDYLDREHFYRIIPIDYYKKAITEISKKVTNPVFFIFTNDQQWVKSNFSFIKKPVFIDLNSHEDYKGHADIEDYELIKNCKHNIIPNSSFSWWAAYLNENPDKIVIRPKKWFNDKFFQKSFEKYPICPTDWKLI